MFNPLKGREGGRAVAAAVWFNGAREGRLESLGADGDEQREREEGGREEEGQTGKGRKQLHAFLP